MIWTGQVRTFMALSSGSFRDFSKWPKFPRHRPALGRVDCVGWGPNESCAGRVSRVLAEQGVHRGESDSGECPRTLGGKASRSRLKFYKNTRRQTDSCHPITLSSCSSFCLRWPVTASGTPERSNLHWIFWQIFLSAFLVDLSFELSDFMQSYTGRKQHAVLKFVDFFVWPVPAEWWPRCSPQPQVTPAIDRSSPVGNLLDQPCLASGILVVGAGWLVTVGGFLTGLAKRCWSIPHTVTTTKRDSIGKVHARMFRYAVLEKLIDTTWHELALLERLQYRVLTGQVLSSWWHCFSPHRRFAVSPLSACPRYILATSFSLALQAWSLAVSVLPVRSDCHSLSGRWRSLRGAGYTVCLVRNTINFREAETEFRLAVKARQWASSTWRSLSPAEVRGVYDCREERTLALLSR